MKTVDFHTAKAQSSRLVDDAAAGAESIIAKAGWPCDAKASFTFRLTPDAADFVRPDPI